MSSRPFDKNHEGFPPTDPFPEERFYAVTNGSVSGLWQAREEDCPALLQTHPGFRIVKGFPSREEAQAFVRSLPRSKE